VGLFILFSSPVLLKKEREEAVNRVNVKIRTHKLNQWTFAGAVVNETQDISLALSCDVEVPPRLYITIPFRQGEIRA